MFRSASNGSVDSRFSFFTRVSVSFPVSDVHDRACSRKPRTARLRLSSRWSLALYQSHPRSKFNGIPNRFRQRGSVACYLRLGQEHWVARLEGEDEEVRRNNRVQVGLALRFFGKFDSFPRSAQRENTVRKVSPSLSLSLSLRTEGRAKNMNAQNHSRPCAMSRLVKNAPVVWWTYH